MLTQVVRRRMKGKIKGIRMGKTVGESGHCRETERLQSRKESVACRRIVEVGLQAKGKFPTSESGEEARSTRLLVHVCTFPRLVPWCDPVPVYIPIDKKISKKKKWKPLSIPDPRNSPGLLLSLVTKTTHGAGNWPTASLYVGHGTRTSSR